jgi:hypothetical protein
MTDPIDPIRLVPPPPPATSDAEWHHKQQAMSQEIADAAKRSFDAAQAWHDAQVPPWATPDWHPSKPGR